MLHNRYIVLLVQDVLLRDLTHNNAPVFTLKPSQLQVFSQWVRLHCIHMHFFFLSSIFWPAFMTHTSLRVLLWALPAMDNITVPVLIKKDIQQQCGETWAIFQISTATVFPLFHIEWFCGMCHITAYPESAWVRKEKMRKFMQRFKDLEE